MLRKIHHVGIVVRTLEEGYRFYRDTLGLRVTKEATVPDQGVRAALLEIGASEIEATKAKGIPVIDQKPRPGLAGTICFLHPKAQHGVLIEYAVLFPDGDH